MSTIAALGSTGLGPSMLAEQRSQRLQVQSLQLELHISSADGRSASLRLDHQSLTMSGSYTRLGLLTAAGSGGGDLMGRVRELVASTLERQGAVEFYSERQEHQISRSQLQLTGDLDLLRGHLSAPSTAQRIFDFVSGLGRSAGIDFTPGASSFVGFMEQISRGVAEGFRQAQALLGELPEISQQTRHLLDHMLEALRGSGDARSIRAADLWRDLAPQLAEAR